MVADAESQIIHYSRAVKFTVTEYSFEHIVQRLKADRYYVPDYQRELIWKVDKQSKFIESLLMGLPIPFLFFWQDKDGRMEIVDGSQRIRSIRDFVDDKFKLRDLEVIPAVNSFFFSDLPKSRQLKFLETPIRVIILDNTTDAITRTEMFARINTGGTTANDAEIRRGIFPGEFMNLVIELANDPIFVELTPISQQWIDGREREELVTRFFAYVYSFRLSKNGIELEIESYKEEPRRFYSTFVKEMNDCIANELKDAMDSPTLAEMRGIFSNTLKFIKAVSPYGFTKSKKGNQVPRVRFESIAVGAALALKADPNVVHRVKDMTPLLNSDEFSDTTKSDAANVKTKLIKRISLTRNWLLEQ